jgi:hypothetical protein
MINTATQKLELIALRIKEKLKLEIKNRGHSLTGELENSITYEVQNAVNSIAFVFSYNDYGRIVNNGTKAARIPYNGRTGRGGTSKYIQALIDYGKKRGIADDKQAKQFAFAVAAKQKKEGMSTKASARFSKNGKRNAWQNVVLVEIEKQIPALIDKYLFRELELVINSFVN